MIILYGLRHKITKTPLAARAYISNLDDESGELNFQFDEYFPGNIIWLVVAKDVVYQALEQRSWLSTDYNHPAWPHNLKPQDYELFCIEDKND